MVADFRDPGSVRGPETCGVARHFASDAVGVRHPISAPIGGVPTVTPSDLAWPPRPGPVSGVGQIEPDPILSLPLMWRVDGASREINAPAGVVFTRQINADSVEPTIASRSRNLLSHDDRGPAGTDEAKTVRPQMPWIVNAESSSGRGERLARKRGGPDGLVVGPAGKSSGN